MSENNILKNKGGAGISDSRFRQEMMRCQYCEEKPCRDGCPAGCSPADFIMAARGMKESDILRAAAIIMKNNPLGGVCGEVCPDKHCMAECSRKLFDSPVMIPDLQAEIIRRASELGGIPGMLKPMPGGKRVAVIGAGPAGLGAAALLAQKGFSVTIYEGKDKPGGMCRLIPSHRLDEKTLEADIRFLRSLGDIEFRESAPLEDISGVSSAYDAVIIAAGLWDPVMPGAVNQEYGADSVSYLSSPSSYSFTGRVGVIGGGATALDCAVTARINGAKEVEMIALETLAELPLTVREREEMLEYGVEFTGRTRVSGIKVSGGEVTGIDTLRVSLDPGTPFSLDALSDMEGSAQSRDDIKHVIIAAGNRAALPGGKADNVFMAGDCLSGPSTVVEAVSSGKNAAVEAAAFLEGSPPPEVEKKTRNSNALPGFVPAPVSLETDFFGCKITTPFLLSAAPPSDGYEQMKKAYEAGWSGGVMKTSFSSGPIHIPSEYMHGFGDRTYGNCDNVSGHLLERVCGEIETLVKEFPDRLTIGSTGGPVTGDDESDRRAWQANTRKLEEAGAMAVEYSLSCPQGGEGTEGDIVSQSPELTAKVIDWVMDTGDPGTPKLFKLTAAVTSINSVMEAVREVLAKHPEKKAGVTLANTFPVMGFQDRGRKSWPNGVVLGMSGEGVVPISYFTLSRAVPSGVVVSGNGGPMDYLQAANFLALGAGTVQFCSIVMKYGYGIIDELVSGLSWLMKSRGLASVKELTGIAQPDPVTDFMDLSPEKGISAVTEELCVNCGNCTRCPYQAVSLNSDGLPETDPSRCIGCSFCTLNCFTGALYMRDRTSEEQAELKED